MNPITLYKEKYGDIPFDDEGRYQYLTKDIKNLDKVEREVEERIKHIEAIGWDEYKYTIYLLPKPTPRPRYTKTGKFMYVKGASDNKKYFRKMIAKGDWNIITTPTIFYCKCYFPIPKSMNNVDKILAEKGYLHFMSIPDFDNLAKTYTDMLKGILLYDDRLIYKGICEKSYSVKPRIEVSLKFLKEYDSDFNRKKIDKSIKAIKQIRREEE